MRKAIILILGLCVIGNIYTYSQEVSPKSNDTNFNNKSVSQENPVVVSQEDMTNQLVIGAPRVSGKTVHMLTDAIDKIKGVEYIMFCPEHKLLLVEFNSRIFTTEEDVISAFEEQDLPFKIFIKDGDFEGIMDLCNQNEGGTE